MNIAKASFLLFLTLFGINFSVMANTQNARMICREELYEHNYKLEKIYLEPSQIHISSEGIFFLNKEGCIENAVGVFRDARGLYVMANHYKCPACGRANRDNICKNNDCVLYGI